MLIFNCANHVNFYFMKHHLIFVHIPSKSKTAHLQAKKICRFQLFALRHHQANLGSLLLARLFGSRYAVNRLRVNKLSKIFVGATI